MKLAIAQVNPTVGDLSGNRKLVEEAADKARAAGADLVVLPEMVLTGYPPMDLLERDGFVRDQLRELEALEKAARDIAIVLGAVLQQDGSRPKASTRGTWPQHDCDGDQYDGGGEHSRTQSSPHQLVLRRHARQTR